MAQPVAEATPAQVPAGGPSLPQERRVVTEIPGPRSRELLARRAAAVAPGVSSVLPVFAAAAGGGVLVDVDGNSFIDLGAGIAVTSVGNADPDVVAALSAQAATFTHTCAMVTPYEGYVAVCEQLARLTPGTFEKRTALFNSGAEAVENGVKVARYATGRQAVVVFDHAYHGRTNLTLAMTSRAMPYKHGFGPFAGEFYRAPMAYPYRWPTGPEHCAEEALAATVDLVNTQIGAENVAAVVVEPILGEGGFVVPAEGFLPGLADFCRANGIVFVADEVQTGIARTGKWFASEHEGIVPDIVITAKGLAGGMPLAGVTGRADLMDSVHPGGLGGTFSGNPVSCAAALATLRTIEEHGLVARAERVGAILHTRLSDMQQRHPAIGDVRGRGAMMALEVVQPGTKTPNPALAKAVAARCHAEGVLVLGAGTYGNVLRFLPPLVITGNLLDEALLVLDNAFLQLQ